MTLSMTASSANRTLRKQGIEIKTKQLLADSQNVANTDTDPRWLNSLRPSVGRSTDTAAQILIQINIGDLDIKA